jgi:ADP-heptose:LPS heptosyltransferase
VASSSNKAGNFALSFVSAAFPWLPGGRRSAEPRNLLVVRLGNLGDSVVALPALHALRRMYPKARMTLLTSPTKRGAPGAADVLVHDKTFDHVEVYYEDESSKPDFVRVLRKKIMAWQIDWAVLLPDDLARFHNVAKHLALLASAGVRHVAGARLVRPQEHETSQVARLMTLLEPLGFEGVEPFPWIHVGRDDEAHAHALLDGTARGPRIGMQCGAKRPANRWPVERFVALGRRLVEDLDASLYLTGSPSETDLINTLAYAIGDECTSIAGETTVTQLAAVAAELDAFISNDTGTMHVVAAMGTPVVAIFSSRDHPFRWFPYGDKHLVLRTDDIECSPCFAEECPLYEIPECLARIQPNEVFDAVREVLQFTPRPDGGEPV